MAVKNGMTFPIMVIGQDKLVYSIVTDLLLLGYPALLLTNDQQTAAAAMEEYVSNKKNLQIITDWPETIYSRLVILITDDQLTEKQKVIRKVEERCDDDTIITVNLEALCLDEIQTQMRNRTRLLGLNWTYPVHRTFFAEIVVNQYTRPADLEDLKKWLKAYWKKDPYVVQHGFSIRARMMAAMLREGIYLVENDFASVESVDRACRNDAGFYLPFVGNFRYMDLMGTYAYGMVMQDLNRELSNMMALPEILQEKRDKEETGMDNGKGFYSYDPKEKEHWQKIFKEFSEEIQQLIIKYPHEPLDR
ncbi:3-hydroxyacyl-CoA dehydrogenase family protein [Sphingobacterium sp. SGR-19]|uniref:3-hydroxyacyl-CoA dehydrogenase family protein n=1 Tax=Sphingobacterium sp. SGR-19 TaxID=2710886 RepID=UPI0013EBB297|nr:3-hydroxyacyl-CoA dehydrogenase family protein [Sphingobacterium sp. SGR-19]NGM64951.1 3-hydroxyacyl-CoA dehydrogenase [Sphingobacterium sp. SGR-19]